MFLRQSCSPLEDTRGGTQYHASIQAIYSCTEKNVLPHHASPLPIRTHTPLSRAQKTPRPMPLSLRFARGGIPQKSPELGPEVCKNLRGSVQAAKSLGVSTHLEDWTVTTSAESRNLKAENAVGQARTVQISADGSQESVGVGHHKGARRKTGLRRGARRASVVRRGRGDRGGSAATLRFGNFFWPRALCAAFVPVRHLLASLSCEALHSSAPTDTSGWPGSSSGRP